MNKYFEKLGKISYDTYCGEVGWKSVRGEPLPQFNDQRETVRAAWIAAAKAVYTEILKDQEAMAIIGTPPDGL